MNNDFGRPDGVHLFHLWLGDGVNHHENDYATDFTLHRGKFGRCAALPGCVRAR